jgi:hypothetical protein
MNNLRFVKNRKSPTNGCMVGHPQQKSAVVAPPSMTFGVVWQPPIGLRGHPRIPLGVVVTTPMLHQVRTTHGEFWGVLATFD